MRGKLLLDTFFILLSQLYANQQIMKIFFALLLLLIWTVEMMACGNGNFNLFLQNDKGISYCIPTHEVDSVTVVRLGSKKMLRIYSPGDRGAYQAFITSADSMMIRQDSASLLEYAAYKEGDDWAPALEMALMYHRVVYVPEGEYSCSQVNIPTGKTLRGSGEKTVFVPMSLGLFRVDGSKGKGTAVAEDVADYSNLLEMTDVSDLNVGDEIMIQSQRNCMLKEGVEGINYDADWVLGRTANTSVFYGEFDKIVSMNGQLIETAGRRIFPSYFKDDSREPELPSDGYVARQATTVYKMAFAKNVLLTDFAIKGTSQCCRPILLKYADSCRVNNVHYTSSVLACNEQSAYSLTVIRVMYSKNTVISNCHSTLEEQALRQLESLERNWDNFSCYNVFKIESSHGCGFEDCSSDGATHAFNIIKSNSKESICSAGCFIRRCSASHNIWSGMNVTQGCWNNEVSGCTVTASGQGITSFARLSVIANNVVSTDMPFATHYIYTHVSSQSNGRNVYWGGTAGIMLAEGYSGGQGEKRTLVAGNVVSGFYTGISIRDGYESKNTFETGLIDITGNAVDGCFNGVGIYRNGYNESPVYLDVMISGNRFVRAGNIASYGNTYTPTPVFVPTGVTGVVSRDNIQEGF